MRVTKSIFLTTLFLAVVQSQQAEQQANQAAFEAHQQPTTTQQDQQSKSNAKLNQQQQQQDQQQPLGAPPQELTPEEFEMAKDGIRQILGQLPIQYVEPLVNTMEGYCSTFGAFCTAACKERMTDDEEEEVQGSTRTKALSLGCADPQALTIGTAGASCQCASYDMTDRINFAIVGGIVTSHRKKSGDFGAEGILDAIQFLPAVPTFLSIIHVLQSICYYVSFLDVLATNANPPSCPANGKAGGVLGTITNLVPGLDGILSNVPALGGLLGGLLGTGGGSEPAPTPATATPTPTSGGGPGDFFRGIFGGGGSTSSKTTPAPTTTTPITTTTTAAGGIWGFFGNIFGGGTTTATTTATKSTIAPTTTATAQVKAPPGATKTLPVAAVNTGGDAKGQTGLPFASVTATTIISTTASSSSPSPTPTPKKDGTLFGWFPTFGLLSEMDENGNLIDTDDDVDAVGGKERVMMEVDDDAQNERQLISNDGRLARIVRVQRRYAEKKSRE
ncbi:hypothetical protein BGX30_005826 [Mortierella sp. GBA39]|nr:hypothetical protein BGX30_005826 [Mortierella sp. GBA39]